MKVMRRYIIVFKGSGVNNFRTGAFFSISILLLVEVNIFFLLAGVFSNQLSLRYYFGWWGHQPIRKSGIHASLGGYCAKIL